MPSSWGEKCWLCQILYDGLDYQNKTLIEIMIQERFLKANEHEGWEIYKDLAEKKPSNWNLPTKSLGIPTYLFQKRSPLDRRLHSN